MRFSKSILGAITLLLSTAAWTPALAGRIELTGESQLVGQILAEKPDHVIVDIGYTVLAVPRKHILSIQTDAAQTNATPGLSSSLPAGSSLFKSGRSSAADKTVRELSAELGQSVVQVRTPSGLGSGFIVNEDGYLITNFHVIEGETQISIEVYQQTNGQLERQSYKDVRIVAMNKFKDLALLKIDDSGAPSFDSVYLGSSDSLAVGDRVFAIGSPLGLERTVTEGILSTKTRQIQGELYLQTTAQINPGNSGGPLFNLRGEVVGVTNMKMTFGEGLGFAIPVESVKFFLNHRDAYAYDNDNPSNPYHYLPPPAPQPASEENPSS